MSHRWIVEALAAELQASIASAKASEAAGQHDVALGDYVAAEHLASELVPLDGRAYVGELAEAIASQARIHANQDRLEEASNTYERALLQEAWQPEVLREAMGFFLKRIAQDGALSTEDLESLAARAGSLAKRYGLDHRAYAAQAHDIALEAFKERKYVPAALLAEMAADLNEGDLHYRSNSGSFWSYCAWSFHDVGSNQWRAFRHRAVTAWERCLEIEPDRMVTRLGVVEYQLTGGEFAKASLDARSCWALGMDNSDRAVCAWLGAMAAIVNDEPEANWIDLRDHLFAVEGELWLDYWKLTEVDGWLPTLEGTRWLPLVRSIHEQFLKIRRT